MNKNFNIYSEIVDDGCKWVEEDVSPSDFRAFAEGVESGDEVTLNINSVGGSVLGGVAIANQIKALNAKGVHTTARVEGLCASIATVIMCACERIVMDNTSFIMIHNCWSQVQGDSNELRKQADVMDKMNDVMMSFYKSKFDLTEEELKSLMDAETWFSGSEAKDFKLNCEVIEGQSEYKIAASISEKHFKNIPKRVLDMKNKAENVSAEETLKEEIIEEVTEEKQEQELAPEEEKKVEEVVEEVTKDETTEEKPEEETVEEKTTEELKEEVEALKARVAELEKENEELKAKCGEKAEEVPEEKVEEKTEEEVVTKAEADKRVSGMQSKMQSQVNALSTELSNFKNQLQAKEEELTKAKAEITSLNDSLTKSTEELSAMASTLEEKTKALEKLNANVNAQAEELPTMAEGLAKCASPAEKVAFIKSGKYVH